MDKRITRMIERTRTMVRFHCECGRMAIVRREDAVTSWDCPDCGAENDIPSSSQTRLQVVPDEVPVAAESSADRPSEAVRALGEQLMADLRTENIGVGAGEIRGYYCLKLNLGEELIEYLRMTSIDIEGQAYLVLSTSAGALESAQQAVKLLGYGTQFGKIELDPGGELALRWILPMHAVSQRLLKEVALSLAYDTFMLKTSVLV